MYDGGKIIGGLVIFVGLVSFPLWYSAAGGEPKTPPNPKKPTSEPACVEDTAFMRASHMDLLDKWRDDVVRGDYSTKSLVGVQMQMRMYDPESGKPHPVELNDNIMVRNALR